MALPHHIPFLYAATLMIRFILLVLFSLVGLTCSAQTAQSIFEWKSGSEITTKDIFLPLIKYSYTVSLNDPKYKVYTLHTYTVKNPQGEAYTIKLNSVDDPRSNRENYNGFSIEYKGKSILTYLYRPFVQLR